MCIRDRFTFSEPVDLVVATKTVDPDEIQSIFAIGPETYFPGPGGAADVTPNGSGISITGTGFGFGPNGSAFGETTSGPSSILTLNYQSLDIDKYGQWMVGKVVPEPNSIALLGIGGIGMMLRGRKRRRRRA